MAAGYYVRWRGRVTGPWSREQIVAMLSRGELSRRHEVSSDGMIWSRIGETEEFASAVGLHLPAADTHQAVQPVQEGQQPIGLNEPKITTDNDWYVAEAGGEPRGPFPISQLMTSIQLGQITPTTLVWNPTMPDWTPASNVFPHAWSSNAAGRESPPVAGVLAPTVWVGTPQAAGQAGKPQSHAALAQTVWVPAGATPGMGTPGGVTAGIGLSSGTSQQQGTPISGATVARLAAIGIGVAVVVFMLLLLIVNSMR
jgi:hypothetical protein